MTVLIVNPRKGRRVDASRDVLSLAEAINRARPRLTETDQRASVALYRLLGDGKPVTPGEVAAATELPESGDRDAS